MRAVIALIAFFIFLSTIPFVSAVTVSVTNVPATLDELLEFGASVSLSCSGCSDSYLRGAFYPSGTSYFGYTQDNSGNWSNSPASGCTTFFKVAQSDLQVGTWSGTLKVKIDKTSPYYNGPGEYLFKVGRYTSSCSSPTWSSETTIAVTGPTPTPTITPVPTSAPPTNTPTPTKTPTPTSTPTSTPTKSPTPTQKPSSSDSPTDSISDMQEEEKSVLGEGTVVEKQKTQVPMQKESVNKVPFILMGIGLMCIVGYGILAYRAYLERKNIE